MCARRKNDNVLRELEPLASGRSSIKARRHGLRALSRAVHAQRTSPAQAAALERISTLIENSGRFADEESFGPQSGPAWERLRQLIDANDPPRGKC